MKTAKKKTQPPHPEHSERPVLDLIAEIRERKTDPKSLSPVDRQECVVHLMAEGLSVPEIAQFLNWSTRTIIRDRKAIQEASALTHDPALAGRIAGQLWTEAMTCVDRMRRVSRDRETPPAVKVDAERHVIGVLDMAIARIQSLGLLPTAAHRVEAQVKHQGSEVPTVEFIQAELNRLQKFTQDYEGPLTPELAELPKIAERVALAARLEVIASHVKVEQPL